jgi:hypothetical protein
VDPHARDASRKGFPVDPISIEKQIRGSRIIRERLDELLGRPDYRGMVGDVEMEEFAPVMSEDDDDEEETKGEGGDDKEVDGDHLAEVSRQKHPPRGGPRRRPAHVLRDGEFGDVVAEEGEFCADAAAAPGGVSRAMRRMRRRSSGASLGRPTGLARDFHRQ